MAGGVWLGWSPGAVGRNHLEQWAGANQVAEMLLVLLLVPCMGVPLTKTNNLEDEGNNSLGFRLLEARLSQEGNILECEVEGTGGEGVLWLAATRVSWG